MKSLSLVAILGLLLNTASARAEYCSQKPTQIEQNRCESREGKEYFVGKSFLQYRRMWLQGIDFQSSNYLRDIWFDFGLYGKETITTNYERNYYDGILNSAVERKIWKYIVNPSDRRPAQTEVEIRGGLGVELTLERRIKVYKLVGERVEVPTFSTSADLMGQVRFVLKLTPFEGQYSFRHDLEVPQHLFSVGARF